MNVTKGKMRTEVAVRPKTRVSMLGYLYDSFGVVYREVSTVVSGFVCAAVKHNGFRTNCCFLLL